MSRVTVNGVDIHYCADGNGEALLLLHGLGASCADWERQLPAFVPHFRVVRMCLRGFGHSDKPETGYSIPEQAQDVVAVLDALAIERCHLLGHSMGGAVGFQLAVDHPERLRSLIVVNSQPSFAIDGWRKRWMLVTRIVGARVLGMRIMTRLMSAGLFPRPGQRALRRDMITRHAGNERRVYLAALRALAGWSVEDRLSQIDLPVLVIAAAADYTSVSEKRRFVDRLPQAQLAVIPHSRHMSHIDQPDALNALVLDFLLGLGGGPHTG